MANNKKLSSPMTREAEIAAAKLMGKPVSPRKAAVSAAVSIIACALPMILGLRLWNSIPEIVATGLIGADGGDDSMPRAVLVFGLPGLMCVLNLICHGQLYFNQRRSTLPKPAIRLIGRWGFPVLSVIFCSIAMMQAAKRSFGLELITPLVLGLVMLLLGSHMFECPTDARVALRFRACQSSPEAWKTAHAFASVLWLSSGLVAIASAMYMIGSSPLTALFILVTLLAPMVLSAFFFR